MNTNVDIEALSQQIRIDSAFLDELKSETNRFIVGQENMIDKLLIGLLADGHILLEGLPGLAKTLAVNTLSKAISASFQRIQFTPDLLPSDIVGTMIYNPASSSFTPQKGPIFANFILADEINRAPAKVQSALLEAMQEKQVTIGKESYSLEKPFLVLATQNPIDQEGTYALPEAQSDRFMLKVLIDYPSMEDERLIIQRTLNKSFDQKVNPVINKDQILNAKQSVQKIYMDEKIEQYILDIVFASRYPEKYNLSSLKNLISFGGSPRASINLAKASKALAFLNRRAFVIPEDVRSIAKEVLRHRIGLTYEAEAENVTQENIIESILNNVQVP